MALNREYIKSKVTQAIEKLPSNGLVVREVYGSRREKSGYTFISNLRGVLYTETTNRNFSISLQDKGELYEIPTKKYLVVYDESSSVVKAKDFIFIEGSCYKVLEPGEDMKIYCLMKLEEEQLKLLSDNVIDSNNKTFQVANMPLEVGV